MTRRKTTKNIKYRPNANSGTLDAYIVSYDSTRTLENQIKPMCNIDRRAEQQIMAMGLSIISKAMEASLSANQPQTSSDVLGAATTAYSQGKITKAQFMAVINALDEQTYRTNAYAEPSWNQEYLEANAYLNQYR